MAETRATIPDRESFKAAEVCEIAGVQPYVLRSWELEFPSIGSARSPGAPRVYRRADVERILRIKALVFTEGLTLAGARRRIEEEDAPAEHGGLAPALAADTREKLEEIRDGLRSLLSMLGGGSPQKAAAWPPPATPGVLEFGTSEPAGLPEAGARKAGRKKAARQ